MIPPSPRDIIIGMEFLSDRLRWVCPRNKAPPRILHDPVRDLLLTTWCWLNVRSVDGTYSWLRYSTKGRGKNIGNVAWDDPVMEMFISSPFCVVGPIIMPKSGRRYLLGVYGIVRPDPRSPLMDRRTGEKMEFLEVSCWGSALWQIV